ncbi:MAG: OmpA family protein [Deltaproteobacteria bacterium]|jgi:outer membrane protein OmpA-like peptidoglycan-associated protein|nr:OmpA family protein [Deltaproteobacteria bacterium]
MRIFLIALLTVWSLALPAGAQFNPETVVAQQLVADQGLFFALAQDNITSMATLRDQGADPNTNLARAGLKPDIVFNKALPIFSQPMNTTGWPILTWAVYLNNEKAVNLLLRAGARVNAPDEYGATALHWAAWAGRVEIAKLLLNNGANCSSVDFKTRTPVDYAIMVNQNDMIRLLKNRSCRQISDEDRDGVADDLDQCPGTPLGAPVDNRGCWVVAYSTFFDFDRDVIKSEFLPHIQQAARILVNNPGIIVNLVGHTDNIGSEEYNNGLGLRRAQSVKRELVRNGVTAARLVEQSRGKLEPINDNSTSSGRARNRRVEIHVEQPQGVSPAAN